MSTGKRRSRSGKQEQSWLSGRILWIAGGVLAIIILAPVVLGLLSGDDETPEVLAGVVEEFPSEGREHVEEGTTVEYSTDPPTSGSHYPRWAPPEFYQEVVQPELLVHNLEHGHIVVYYSPDKLSDEAAARISALNEQYNSEWEAVMAVPRQDPDHELVLTAWTRMLELETYDEELVNAFVDAYRGRGPENPIR